MGGAATSKPIPPGRHKPKYGQPSRISPLQSRGMRANDARASAPWAHFHANDNTTTTVLHDGRSRDRDRHSSYLLRAKLSPPPPRHPPTVSPPAPSWCFRCFGRNRRTPFQRIGHVRRTQRIAFAEVALQQYRQSKHRYLPYCRTAHTIANRACPRSKRARPLSSCAIPAATRGLSYLDVSLASFARFMRRDNGRETQWWPTRVSCWRNFRIGDR